MCKNEKFVLGEVTRLSQRPRGQSQNTVTPIGRIPVHLPFCTGGTNRKREELSFQTFQACSPWGSGSLPPVQKPWAHLTPSVLIWGNGGVLPAHQSHTNNHDNNTKLSTMLCLSETANCAYVFLNIMQSLHSSHYVTIL